ncbi:hypothetical protein EC957_011055 [Mortierella hygrophila]|uniref:Uncharacterized protein n=1 Tax=Mortierella hygrophila TaxID=979708 RepID=A0A9P6K442_9FUNG|nr:hypothetical protein EC957_011055 [Mortierella hygrophila]
MFRIQSSTTPSKKTKKENVDKTHSNALLSCNRILDIKELCDLICSFLPRQDDNGKLIYLSPILVCRHWHSYFISYHVEEISFIHKPSHKLTSLVKPHGHLIRQFSCGAVDKTLLTMLAEYCPFLKEVKLELGKEAYWMEYEYLERMFRILSQARFQWDSQDRDQLSQQEHGHEQGQSPGVMVARLRKVEINIDLEYLKPAMLWSLCHISHLTDLSINGRGMIGQERSSWYLENLTLSLLECCPGVERFRICYSPQRMIYHPCGYKSQFKEKVWDPRQSGRAPPLVPKDAVMRRGVVSSFGQGEDIGLGVEGESQEGSLSSAAATHMGSGSGSGTQAGAGTGLDENIESKPFILRQLELRGTCAEMDTLLHLFERCPLLEQVSLFQSWSALHSDHWHALSTHSQQTLRTIRLSAYNYNHLEIDGLNIPDLLTLFPQLEILHVVESPHQHLNLTALDSSLSKLELEQQGRPHPLRTFYVMGNFDEVVARLVDVISCPSLKCLETLKVGYLYTSSRYQVWTETPETSHQGALYDFTRPWEAVGRTLVRLDLDGLDFPDRQVTAKFFRKLEGFRSLKVLRASVRHFQDVISTSSSYGSSPSLSPSATTNDDTPPSKPAILPVVDYCFPSIQDLLIRNQHCGRTMYSRINGPTFSSEKEMLSLDQMLFLLAATPSLENLLLQFLCVDDATAAVVRSQFRGVYVDTNHQEYLSWFDE